MLQTKEGPALGGAGVLLGREHRSYTEFDAQTLVLSERLGVSLHHARTILRLLRGGDE